MYDCVLWNTLLMNWKAINETMIHEQKFISSSTMFNVTVCCFIKIWHNLIKTTVHHQWWMCRKRERHITKHEYFHLITYVKHIQMYVNMSNHMCFLLFLFLFIWNAIKIWFTFKTVLNFNLGNNNLILTYCFLVNQR